MASKKQKVRPKGTVTGSNPRSYSQLYKDDKTVPSAAPKAQEKPAATTVVETTAGDDRSGWAREYAYVFHDLRQLLIVSVAIFALIVAVGLLL